MTEEEIRAWLNDNGWEPVEIDMRGPNMIHTIEGWSWQHPDLDESFQTAGTWSELPPIQEDLRAYVGAQQ